MPANSSTQSLIMKWASVFRMVMHDDERSLMLQPSMMYGYKSVPVPETTPLAEVKPELPFMAIASWVVAAETPGTDAADISSNVKAGKNRVNKQVLLCNHHHQILTPTYQ